MEVELNVPQSQFIEQRQKFRGFVGGYRSGKTYIGCLARILHFMSHPGLNQGYFAPTYPQIRDIFYPTIEEVCSAMSMWCSVNQGNKEVHIYNGRKSLGTVICRSMEKPDTIVGFKIADALVDEIDTLPINKAEHAWRKIIARMSYKGDGVRNGVDVTTTPEGFRFVYKQFYKKQSEQYGMVRASTYENEINLPPDYIPSLLDTYPPELVGAYLNGEFVNLTTGSVYRNYNRDACASREAIQPNETLYIGQDFNIRHMASVIYVKRDKVWHAVDEIVEGLDTPSVVETIKEKWPGHQIIMYPDATGNSGSSKGASVSDISILRSAGFTIRARSSNPRVRDRVLSANTAFYKGLLKVNADKCPVFADCLEQQAYDANGEPDKKTGHDHQNDAGTYPIVYEMPVERPVIKPRALPGI